MAAILQASASCASEKNPLQEQESAISDSIQTYNSPFDDISKYDYTNTNDMAFSLFHEVDKRNKNKNFTISPLSMANALAMLVNGADGNTLNQIKDVLGVKGKSIEEIDNMYSALNRYLQSADSSVTFTNANSIWIDDNFKIKNDFISKNKQLFNAEIRNQSLPSEKTMNDVNSWCEKKTNGCIKEILTSIPDANTRMILINALYFKGGWSKTFDEEITKKEDFTNSDGSKSKVYMMHQTDEFEACFGKKVDMVEFPYGYHEFYMQVLLPHKGENLDECLKDLNSEQLRNIESQIEYAKVNVSMPRMELRYDTSFKDCLRALGMKDAFAPNACFPNISNEETYVSDINQSTFIKINENGTEAAAITTAVLLAKSIEEEPVKIHDFIINRPFAYIIRDTTGTILFMGKVRKL